MEDNPNPPNYKWRVLWGGHEEGISNFEWCDSQLCYPFFEINMWKRDKVWSPCKQYATYDCWVGERHDKF